MHAVSFLILRAARSEGRASWYSPALLLCLIFGTFARAEPIDEPPLKNQPEHFNGAVGAFKIAARATPTEVQAEDPILFSVRLTSTGAVRQPPRRPNLKKLPKFTARFHIEDLPERDTSSPLTGGQAWEFHYHLKPRDPEVTEIPTLRFDYYKPAVARYQADFTRSIPLTVRPRAKAVLADGRGEARIPERFYQIVAGPEVFRRPLPKLTLTMLPGLWLVPPAACLVWYFLCRHLYPDAARMARLRRSQAGKVALQALHDPCPAMAVARANRASAVLEAYLRERFDLRTASPTPVEVLAHLEGLGLSNEIAVAVADFFRSCDAVRFAPDPISSASPVVSAAEKDPRSEAERLILVLEGMPCTAPK